MKINTGVNFDRLARLTGAMAIPENSVIRQLASFERLALHERELIWKSCKDATTYAPNSLVKVNDDAHYFLISGWACRQWIREDGRQQIIDFVLPGDTITPIRSPKHASTVSLLTLTSARFASATSVHQLVSNNAARYPGLTKAFAVAVNSEYQRLFDQLIRPGPFSSVVSAWVVSGGRLTNGCMEATFQLCEVALCHSLSCLPHSPKCLTRAVLKASATA